MHASRTFTTRIDIPEQSRRQLIELLNARLADAFDFYSQLKQAHWNVKGSDFIQLHELYDTVAADVLEHVVVSTLGCIVSTFCQRCEERRNVVRPAGQRDPAQPLRRKNVET
jgi:hypothetical protein